MYFIISQLPFIVWMGGGRLCSCENIHTSEVFQRAVERRLCSCEEIHSPSEVFHRAVGEGCVPVKTSTLVKCYTGRWRTAVLL